MTHYNPSEIEPKWQQKWAAGNLYAAKDFDDKQKYVMLTEFPYPSGDGLHLGHAREYTLGDIMARHKRMQGYNVLFPMGYDAFGLPTENYAIKNKIRPQDATDRNVGNFQKQFERLGYSIDWSRSFRTSDPEYYRWTQWLFLQFFKHDMAYQDDISINWCPKCKTGLANEEVVDGKHERCGTSVEKKQLKQWMLRITRYADQLIENLNTVDYPSRIADQQINWIGRSVGAEVDFEISSREEKITVFTTRPDTLFGATFLVLAPEHELVDLVTTEEQKAEVTAYVKAAQAKSEIERQNTDREKTGVFTGAYAVNPLTHEEIPVYIADYVLTGYGTGAIMAVPAHDERDNEFAKKFGLPIKEVIVPDFGIPLENATNVSGVVVIGYDPRTKKFMTAMHDGLSRLVSGGHEENETYEATAYRELKEEAGFGEVEKMIPLGGPVYSYYHNPVKDSDRRSKGYNFLAIIDSTKQGEQQLEELEKDFSVAWFDFDELYETVKNYPGGRDHWLEGLKRAKIAVDAYVDDKEPEFGCFHGDGVLDGSGAFDGISSAEAREAIVTHLEREGKAKEKVNYRLRDWIFSRQHYWGEPIPVIHCREHGAVAVPDDQLPVTLPEVEHYEPTDTGESPLAAITEWVETTCPTCGKPAKRETDTMPNWAGSSWYYARYFDAHNDQAFADPEKLKYWGMVDMYLGGMEHTTLHLLYSRFWHEFLHDIGLYPTTEPYAARRGQGIILAEDGRKMSKSLGNVINPLEVVDAGYGADALRVAIAFIAPFDQTTPWDQKGVAGTHRFLSRVWNLIQEHLESDTESEVPERLTHLMVKKVSDDLDNMNFNTAIAAMMEYTNELYKLKVHGVKGDSWRSALSSLVKVLAPCAPHMSEELWSSLGYEGSVHVAEWPKYDESKLVTDTVKIVLQVNGKLRAQIEAPADASKEDLEKLTLENERVQEFLADKKPTRVVVVPGRLVNVVV